MIKLAKDAPAPIATNNAGKAQHIRVEEEANKDKKLAVLSFIIVQCNNIHINGILTVYKNILVNIGKINDLLK